MTQGSVGPALPPELLEVRKRKRALAATVAANDKILQSSVPALNGSTVIGQTTGSTSKKSATEDHGKSLSAQNSEQGARQSLEADEQDEESDEEVGPQLANDDRAAAHASSESRLPSDKTLIEDDRAKKASDRPAWMLEPPTAGDLSKSFNPLKSRAFSSKPQRGTASSASAKPEKQQEASSAQAEQTRQTSLYDMHNQKRRRTDRDSDDPSKRMFDREKDIVSNTSLKRTNEFVNRSKDLKSRFS